MMVSQSESHRPLAGRFLYRLRLFGALAVWGALACLGPGSEAEAHPISLTSVFVNVEEEKIAVELNMLVEDLILYYWMETNEDFRFPAETLKTQARKHQEFLLRHIHLRDRDGNRLEGEIVDIDFSELDENGVHIDELMAHSIRYHFTFSFDVRPDFLTISQDFGGSDPSVPAEMGVRFFHHGVHMETVMLSHSATHTVTLDWEAGWENARDDLEAARERLRQRKEDALGITSYSAVYSYVYITDTEVRHEILIPLLTLDSWLPLGRETSEVMTIEEQRAVRNDVYAFLKEHNRIRINGSIVTPTLERLNFFGPEYRDFAREASEQQVSVYNARVGVILSFPTDEIPGEMEFEWNYFNDRLPVFRSTVFPFDGEGFSASFDRWQKTVKWKSEATREPIQLAALETPPPPPVLRLPILSVVGGVAALAFAGGGFFPGSALRRLVCAGLAAGLAFGALAVRPYVHATVSHPFQTVPEISDAEMQTLFQALHRNIYRAFEFREEERIYDALDRSVAGQLLEDLYLQIRRNLQIEEQGGAISRVREIELLEGSREPVSGVSVRHQAFVYRSTWTVTGTVEHWGHIHTRTNQYEAIFTIEGFSSGWKITAFEPLQEERLQMQIGLRK